MNHTTHNAIVTFIWNIADDVLRDVYVRGKYRDVILPMTVIRRLDVLLEPTKDKVLELNAFLDQQTIYHKAAALEKAAGYKFYNTSKFTLRRLLDEPKLIRANFENYLDGFSENVQEIINKFKFRNQLPTLVEANRLYALVQKFLSKDINLGPDPVLASDRTVIHEGLTNLGMGYVFEELIRRFNEENNEEAGEHFTPRDIIRLMVNLIFLPIKNEIQSGTYLVYDPTSGSGGMLTEAETFLEKLAAEAGKRVSVELFGQEVNPETYAICQSDMLIKGRDPANIKYGSTLSDDGFPNLEFDFMLANPPYGKSWKVDQERMMEGRKEVTDPRFAVNHPNLRYGEKLMLIPRVSDGQLLFQVTMLSKMKRATKLGSRIAVVHNGSALFTGDAGQGESNIRRWVLENDWLEAIIGLPENMFYNTGIATYIWVLTNRKPEHRKGKVQLIDATNDYRKLRKNLGQKNAELADADISRITQLFLDFQETPESKIFDNADFGYSKIVVERPLRLTVHVTPERLAKFKEASDARLHSLADLFASVLGDKPCKDFNAAREALEHYLKANKIKTKQADLKVLWNAFSQKDETAAHVIKEETANGVAYEPDPELRDTENVPLKESIDEYFEREVLPYVPDAWIDRDKTQTGCEISFTKYFYKYQPLRRLEDITADILALEQETEGLLHRILDLEGNRDD